MVLDSWVSEASPCELEVLEHGCLLHKKRGLPLGLCRLEVVGPFWGPWSGERWALLEQGRRRFYDGAPTIYSGKGAGWSLEA